MISIRVGIVLLNWNNFEDTARCLDLLMLDLDDRDVIYVVDNASSDGSYERLVARYGDDSNSRVHLLRNEANLGFSGGCNTAIRSCLDNGADYVLLLNNDCVPLYHSFIGQGVMALEQDAGAGIAGGKILFWPPDGRIWSTGGYVRRLGSEVHIGHGQFDVGQYDQPAKRDFISGACMLIRTTVFEELGLLPEAYFFGKEEWEFSLRARRAGWNLLYVPQMMVWHEASHSHSWADPAYVYNGVLGHDLYRRRNFPYPIYRCWRSAYRVNLLLFPLRARFGSRGLNRHIPPRPIAQALRDGWMDAPGVDAVREEDLEAYRSRMAG